MLDAARVSLRLSNWRNSGLEPVRLWLRAEDMIELFESVERNYAWGPSGWCSRFAGVPITQVCHDAQSRVVFADGSAAAWICVTGRGG